jgi:hypothetical protein
MQNKGFEGSREIGFIEFVGFAEFIGFVGFVEFLGFVGFVELPIGGSVDNYCPVGVVAPDCHKQRNKHNEPNKHDNRK